MSNSEETTERLQSTLDRAAADGSQVYAELLTQASERLVRLTRKMLRAYPHLRRWEQTDDVFQLAAMRLYRSLESVQPESVGAFWGLAATQIRRTLIDLARHHFGPEGAGRHHHSDGDQHDQSGVPAGVVGLAADPADGEPASIQAWSEFHESVDRLPESEREVFHLVWYGGLPQKTIAEMLNVSLPTVQRRWYSAQLQLYQLMHGEHPGSDAE